MTLPLAADTTSGDAASQPNAGRGRAPSGTDPYARLAQACSRRL